MNTTTFNTLNIPSSLRTDGFDALDVAQAPSPPRMGAGLDLWETLGGLTFTQRGNVQARAGRTSTSLPEKQHEYSNKWAGLKAGSVLSPIPMPRIDAGLDLWETLGGLASTGRADRRLVGELLVGLMSPLAVQRRLGIDEERLSDATDGVR